MNVVGDRHAVFVTNDRFAMGVVVLVHFCYETDCENVGLCDEILEMLTSVGPGCRKKCELSRGKARGTNRHRSTRLFI